MYNSIHWSWQGLHLQKGGLGENNEAIRICHCSSGFHAVREEKTLVTAIPKCPPMFAATLLFSIPWASSLTSKFCSKQVLDYTHCGAWQRAQQGRTDYSGKNLQVVQNAGEHWYQSKNWLVPFYCLLFIGLKGQLKIKPDDFTPYEFHVALCISQLTVLVGLAWALDTCHVH